MKEPIVGSTVHVLIEPGLNGGSDVAPAVITRVLEYTGAPAGVVQAHINVRVLADSNNTLWWTDVSLFDERLSVDALNSMFPSMNPQGAGRGKVAFLPPRA